MYTAELEIWIDRLLDIVEDISERAYDLAAARAESDSKACSIQAEANDRAWSNFDKHMEQLSFSIKT